MEHYNNIIMKRTATFILVTTALLTACNVDQNGSDAFGNFESIPVMVSAENPGKIVTLTCNEGDLLKRNEVVGDIDSMQLHLKKIQLVTSLELINAKAYALDAQIRSQRVQMQNLEREFNRLLELLRDGAATEKQKDDLEGNMNYLEAQIAGLEAQRKTFAAERSSLQVQIDQAVDLISRSVIRNPIDGVVLQKYKQEGEIVAPGQAIYKVAAIDKLNLRAYISGNQLSQVKIGQQVTVRFDGEKGIEELPGKVIWVASQAEFTPRIIQTREERVNLVYPIKVEVANDGRLKIGMPGEVKL